MGVDTITEVRQYLTFKLSEEAYALTSPRCGGHHRVSKIRARLSSCEITCVATWSRWWTCGWAGCRRPEKRSTPAIAVEVDLEGESTIIGALADSVEVTI